jgi:sulfur carrier protein
MTIAIVLNGEERTLDREMTVRELVEHLEIRSPAMAVEIDRKIIKKGDFDTARVTDGSKVEIVTFVGGG